MQVTKIIAPPEAPTPAVKMLDAGLITSEEHDRILAEARKIFVPFLAELL